MLIKVAVYTITHNRLDYTKRAFDTLRRKAGVEYNHYVFDNGSTDGTVNWLQEQDDITLLCNDQNIGQHAAANELLRRIREAKESYDYILRFDNDCFMRSKRLLSRLIEVSKQLQDAAILSPYVTGLNWQPDRFAEQKVDGYKLGFSEILGGIFRLHPAKLLDSFSFDVRQPMGFGEAAQIAKHCVNKKIAMVYVENLFVSHGESTQIQEQKTPEYFDAHVCLQRYPYVPAI